MNKLFKLSKEEKIEEAKRLGWVSIGAFIDAFCMNVIAIPVGLYSGGFMGLAQLIRTFIKMSLGMDMAGFDFAGLIYFALNVPLFLIAAKQLGNMYIFRSLSCVAISTFFFSIIPVPATPIVDDVLTAVMLGGLGAGVGGGLILRSGSANGGTDLVGAILIRKNQNLKISQVSNTFNFFVYGLMAITLNIQTVIYSAIRSVMYTISVDKVFSQNITVEVHIITRIEAVAILQERIFTKLNRGVTKWEAVGAYTGNDKEILYVIVNKYQVQHLIALVKKYDPQALIIENAGIRVHGNFLKNIN